MKMIFNKTFKNLMFAALFSLLVVASGVAHSEARRSPGHPSAGPEVPFKDGPEVPFPWSVTVPFPWSTIEGVWQITNGSTVWFSFEVEVDSTARKILHVLQLDPSTHAVLAEGVGVASADNKIVRAVMAGKNGSYMVFIGAYKKTRTSTDAYTVVTLRSLASAQAKDVSVTAQKIATAPFRASSAAPYESNY
jgi:hypothetical protein